MRPAGDVTVELEFSVAYGIELLAELPVRDGTDHVFARDGRVVDGGLLVEVITAGGGWTGLVANAPDSVSAAHSGIYATPASSIVCVVARGDAYLVDVATPARWWVLKDSPVIAGRSALSAGLLVLATPWRVVAIDATGVKWRTSRLAIDGLRLGDPTIGEIAGIADPDDAESRDFVVDLSSGQHRGGFPFPA